MAKRDSKQPPAAPARRSSPLIDTRVIYCGDNLDQLKKLPDACIDLIYIDPPARPKPLRRGEGPPFNSNRNYEVFWGETKEKRAFEDRHASTQAYIEYMSTDLAASGGRPRCVELARVLKKTGSFYYHCDWHASHDTTMRLDQNFRESRSQSEQTPTGWRNWRPDALLFRRNRQSASTWLCIQSDHSHT